MTCIYESRLCACKDGYVLDSSGKLCVEDTATMSEVDCDKDSDCSLLPHSQCHKKLSKLCLLIFN